MIPSIQKARQGWFVFCIVAAISRIIGTGCVSRIGDDPRVLQDVSWVGGSGVLRGGLGLVWGGKQKKPK